MSPTFLVLPMTDGKLNAKFISNGHIFVPSVDYFFNLREVVCYSLTHTRIPVEINGVLLRSDEFMRMGEVIDGILRQDGSVTSKGKTFDFIFKKMKMVYRGAVLVRKLPPGI